MAKKPEKSPNFSKLKNGVFEQGIKENAGNARKCASGTPADSLCVFPAITRQNTLESPKKPENSLLPIQPPDYIGYLFLSFLAYYKESDRKRLLMPL